MPSIHVYPRTRVRKQLCLLHVCAFLFLAWADNRPTRPLTHLITMEADNETTSLRILEVLCQIKAKLDDLDHHLEVVELMPKHIATTSSDSAEVGVSVKRATKDFRSFSVDTDSQPTGEEYLHKVNIFGKDLVALFRGISGLCLDTEKNDEKDGGVPNLVILQDLIQYLEITGLVCGRDFPTEEEGVYCRDHSYCCRDHPTHNNTVLPAALKFPHFPYTTALGRCRRRDRAP